VDDRYFMVADLAYLAGIIDGEGCISLSKSHKNDRYYYRLQLTITNTSAELKQWLEDKFGGRIRTSYARSNNRSDILHWTVSGNQCQWLLRQVLPYLIIKKPQAELALMMNINPYGGTARWNSIYTEEEESLREKIRIAIHEYNLSGGNKGSYLWGKSLPKKEVSAPLR